MQKFEEFLEKILMLSVIKFISIPIVSVIKDGMIASMPFLVVGSIGMIIKSLPIPGWSDLLLNEFAEGTYADALSVWSNVTFDLFTLAPLAATVITYVSMGTHFIYKNGDGKILINNMEKYFVFALGTFAVYGYFAMQAKKIRQTFILDNKQDIYSKYNKMNVGILELNLLHLSYYLHFYLLLACATLILLFDYYFSKKMKKII